MRKALLLALFLASCGGSNPTAMDVAAQLDQALTVADTAIRGYIKLPDCALPDAGKLCSDTSIVAKLGPVEQAAYDAISAYETAAIDPNTANDALAAAKASAVQALANLTALTALFPKG